MSNKIIATVGRVMLYFPTGKEPMNHRAPGHPLPALVVDVHGDKEVSLTVFDATGNPYGRTGVPVVQAGEPKPEGKEFATWMDYQVGQAPASDAVLKRLDALEREVASLRPPVRSTAPTAHSDTKGAGTMGHVGASSDHDG